MKSRKSAPKNLDSVLLHRGYLLPDVAEQLKEALPGTEIRIPISDYLAHIASTDYAATLKDHLRLEGDDYSPAQAQNYMQTHAEDMQHEIDTILTGHQQADSFRTSQDAVKATVLDQLNKLNRFSSTKNELDATLISARMAVRAAQLGITPEQMYEKQTPNFAAESVGGGMVYGQFAGQQARTADKTALTAAQQRLTDGEDKDQVRKDTGWFKGVDGKWRFEIDDSQAEFIGKDALIELAKKDPYNVAELPLSEVLKHEKLFLAYPELKYTSVYFDADTSEDGGHAGASFKEKENTIILGAGLSIAETESALFHEIQHAIQRNEGFAKGGSASQFKDKDLTESRAKVINEKIQALFSSNLDFANLARQKNRDFIEIENAYGQDSKRGRRLNWDNVPENERDNYFELLDKLNEFPEYHDYLELEQERSLKYKENNSLSAFEQYQRLAGEIEARNTQARQGLSEEQRRDTAPSATQDIADHEAIVVWNGNEIASQQEHSLGNLLDPNKSVKIINISGNEIGGSPLSSSRIKEWLLDEKKWHEMPPVVNEDTGNSIGFTVKGIKASLKRKSDNQRKAYAGLQELIKSAVLVNYENIKEGKAKDSHLQGYEVYYGALNIDGKIYGVKIKVEIPKESLTDRGRSYKDHKIIDIEVHSPAASQGSGELSPVIDYPKEGPTQAGEGFINLGLLIEKSNKNKLHFNQQRFGSFHPPTNTIAIFKQGNLSTVLHELGHFFFENDIALAAELATKPELTAGEQQIVSDVSALLNWSGIQGTLQEQLDQWYSMDIEEKRGAHERTAEAFEAYLVPERKQHNLI